MRLVFLLWSMMAFAAFEMVIFSDMGTVVSRGISKRPFLGGGGEG